VLDQFPRTSTGKINRRELEAQTIAERSLVAQR
jgi:acyl-coenzyme A synthetase/AMP-(fatty) acid ligase